MYLWAKIHLPGKKTYRNLFACQVDGKLLDEIRANTHKGMAVGNDRLKTELEKLT